MSRALAEREPWQVWNAFVGFLADAPYPQLSALQRAAYLAFWYDSEVQNGGHLQYFLNRGETADETIPALRTINLRAQATVLEDALARWRSTAREPPCDSAEYCDIALQSEFDEIDREYHRCLPSVQEALEACLEANRAEFVEIVDVA